MKLIKKIAAIMFAFMMVVSMSCNVKAEDTEGVYGQKDGSITITGALQGQTYTIYEMLKLESFSGNNYSYKIADGWENFFKEGADGATYMKKDENGYMSFIAGKGGDADRREFAQKALAYATKATGINKETKSTQVNETTVTFNGLNLGYYLVGSTTGALCGLDTTNKHVDIEEKNGVPSVDKAITSGGVLATDYKSNSVNIGDTITFQTTIHVQKGAKSYVLTDKMSDGLKLKDKYSEVFTSALHVEARNDDGSINDVLEEGTHYDLTKTSNGFIISFRESYLKTHENEKYQITVTYAAILTEAAVIGGTGNTNETYLKYGVSSESNHSTTTTYTFGIPVFKYTGKDTPLAGAEFKLYTDSNCNDESTALKFSLNNNKYRYDSTNGKTVLTSLETTGHIDIEGLKEGTYYLKETKAPKGYNLLKAPLEIKIDSVGKIYLNGSLTENAGDVRVQNKSGTVLPSTGGAGTTMIYLIGGALVLGSGVVLVTKRRVKGK